MLHPTYCADVGCADFGTYHRHSVENYTHTTGLPIVPAGHRASHPTRPHRFPNGPARRAI